jgi:opacity protein-like surface antigen
MRKLLFVLSAVVFLSLSGLAQDKFDLYGGYSLFRLDANAAPGDRNLQGFDAEIGGKILPYISIIGDVSGHFHSQDAGDGTGNTVDTSLYNFLVGPRVSVKLGSIKPFAHALFGVARGKTTESGFADVTQNNFATAIGGGVDIAVAPFISIRPVKLDYVLVRTDPNQVVDAFGNGISRTNNLRYSAGIVLHF